MTVTFGQTHDTIHILGKPVMPMSISTGELDNLPPGASACENSNFSMGNFTNWTGCYGSYFPSTCTQSGFLTVGTSTPFQPPLHKMIGSAWVDGNTNCNGNGIVTAYTGEEYVVRLGDTIYTSGPTPQYKAAEMKYAVDVSAGINDFFIYRYAVVLNSGGHTPDQQPDFLVEIVNAAGQPLDPVCGTYSFTAPGSGPPPAGWSMCGSAHGDVYWRDWTTVGLDLSTYAGQTVYIRFKVQGCIFRTHFGYAYVSAFCSSMNIALSGCEGTGVVTMTGPPGFSGYEWNGPGPTGPIVGTSQSCTITAAQGALTGNVFYLKLTAVNGCVLEKVMQTIMFTKVMPGFTGVINCTGNESSFTDISHSTNPNQPIINRKWRFDAAGPFTPLTTNATITHTYSVTGLHQVTCESYSLDNCIGDTTITIYVGDPPLIENLPTSYEICSGENVGLSLTFNPPNPGSGADAIWTSSVTSGVAVITHNPAGQSGVLIDDVIVNAGPDDAVVTYTMTPRIGDCIGTAITFNVTVHPLPGTDAFAIASQVYCNGTPTNLVPVTGPVTGAVYTWSNSNTTIGLAATGTGDIPVFTPTNAGPSPITANITATATANNCEGPPTSYAITVNPSGQVTDPGDLVVCNGTSVSTTFNTTNQGGNTTYAWTNTTTTIGLAASGTGNIAAFTATNTGTSPVTATITVTPTYINALMSCPGQAETFTITVNPTAQVIFPGNQVLCNGDETSDITFNTQNSGGTTTYTWTNSNTTIGLAASGNGPIAQFTAINTGLSPVIATISVTPHFDNGSPVCDGPAVPFTITVNPTGQVTFPGNQVLCNGHQTNNVTFATNNLGGTTTYSWTNSNTTIGLVASGSGAIAQFTAVNTGQSPEIATIVVTPHFDNGLPICDGPTTTFTYTVNPTAQVDFPGNQVLCNAQTTNTVTFNTNNLGGTTTYLWTNSNTTIGLAASGSGQISQFTAVNTGQSPVVATIVVTPSFDNGNPVCDGPTTTFTITVNPTAQVNNPGNQIRCNGFTTNQVNFSTNRLGGTTTYTWTNSNTSIGLAATGSGAIAIFTAVNTGQSPEIATIVVTPSFDNGAPPCDGPSETFTITVNPTAQVNNPGNQVLCNGFTTNTVAFSTNRTGGVTTYAWTNSNTTIGLAANGSGQIAQFTAINAGQFPVIATIIVTPAFDNGGPTCYGPTETFTITVNPTAQVANPGNQVLCNGFTTNPVNFSTNNLGGTTTYTWTNSNTTIGLAATGSSGIAMFTAVNSGQSPEIATIVVTPSFDNGPPPCDGPAETFTITVNPTAQVNNPGNQVLCNGFSTNPVAFSTNRTGGTTSYTWTNSNTTIGLAPSGSGPITQFAAINTGQSPVIATIIVTPGFYNGGPTCYGPTETFTITVNPTAQVNNPGNQVLCNGFGTNQVNFSTNRLGGTTSYTWTNSNTTIGLAATGSGAISIFTAVNTGQSPETATIVVSPSFDNGAPPCDGPAETFTITVNPTAQVNNPGDQVLCNGFPTTDVAFSTNRTGGITTYAWTNSNTTIGLAATGSGQINQFTAINNGQSPAIATIVVTPSFHNGGPPCYGPTETFTITVNPTAQVYNPGNQVLCNGVATNPVTFTTNRQGGTTTYTWTNSNTTIGLAATGNGTIALFTAVNSNPFPVTATIVVTPHFDNGAPICDGPAETFTITVNPTAEVNFPGNQVRCHGFATNIINFTTTNLGGTTTYTWTNSNTTIGLTASGNGPISSFTTSNPGLTTIVATITVTPHFSDGQNTCDGTPVPFTITVNPLPIPPISGVTSVCSGTTGLIYYTATGMSSYQWTISSGGTFTAGPGSHEITVAWNTNGAQTVTANYIDGNGCTAVNASTYQVTVMDLPVPNLTGSQYVCDENIVKYYTDPSASSYVWTPPAGGTSSPGITPDTLIVHWQTPGNHTIYVNYTVGTTGCTAATPTPLPVTVNANPTPLITAIPAGSVCGNSTVQYSTSGTGNQYQWTITGGTNQTMGNSNSIYVLWANTPPVMVDLTETKSYLNVSCSTVAQTLMVTLKPWPSAPDQILGNNQVCKSSSEQYHVPAILNAVSHIWNYTGTGTTLTGNGTSSITLTFSPIATSGVLTVKGNNDCGDGPVSDPLVITVNPRPVVDYSVCNDIVTVVGGKRFMLKGGSPLLQGIPSQEGYSTSNGAMGNNPIELVGGNYYFNPALLTLPEAGVYPVTYRYTNQFGCDASSIAQTITVLNPATTLTGCPGILTDPRTSPPTAYKVVWIGSHCWMQENLRYGNSISYNANQTDNCTFERYCLSTDDPNCSKYGGLYQWDELVQYDATNKAQGFCPPGWHIPNELEWDDLIFSVSGGIGTGIAGSFMTNLSVIGSFKADPAGIFYLNNLQSFAQPSPKATFYWTSSFDPLSKIVLARGMNSIAPSVSRYESSRANAFPVRCVKD